MRDDSLSQVEPSRAGQRDGMQRRQTTKRMWLFCGYFLAIGGGLTVYALRDYLQLAVARHVWPIFVIIAVAILFQGSLGIALDRYLTYVSRARRETQRRR